METALTIPALRALRRILRASDLSNRQLAAATALTPSQLLVLQEIADRGETTPTALSAALQFSQATITNICDRLVATGLAVRERDAEDKRRIHLSATPRGRQVVEDAPDLLQARFTDRFGALPKWEQAMILAGLERLGALLDIATTDAAPLLDTGEIDRSSASGG
jgi:DNA-binding MarR family transcriptional regulator